MSGGHPLQRCLVLVSSSGMECGKEISFITEESFRSKKCPKRNCSLPSTRPQVYILPVAPTQVIVLGSWQAGERSLSLMPSALWTRIPRFSAILAEYRNSSSMKRRVLLRSSLASIWASFSHRGRP